MASRVFRTTAAMMSVLNRFLRFSLHVEGLNNITDRPTLFVVNHFTRMETFIVPYVLHKHTVKELRALADARLFKGIFGGYLKRMGATSTREPLRNRMIIGDLVSGRHDWVIFPEGVMVKSKKVVHKGKLRFLHGEGVERPHTGAAVLALKAELVRERLLRAWRENDSAVLDELESRYDISVDECLNNPGLVITPVNITFYPLRPDDNAISKLAAGIRRSIPDYLVEELMTEGSLLLKKTDMTLYFSPPIEVGEYLARPLSILRRLPFMPEVRKENLLLMTQRWPLTRRFMKVIYSTTAINLDHLFCLGLKELKADTIRIEDFHRALYLAALTIRQHEGRRVHKSLHNKLVRLVADETHEPLESIYELAHSKGIVEREDGNYRLLHRFHHVPANHENLRLHGTPRVIANEAEPMPFVVDTVARYVNMEVDKARSELARRMAQLDNEHFEEEYRQYQTEESKPPEIGRPFILKGDGDTGILLCHGYLAAPEEMRPLGDFLHGAGYTVYGARLQGFGTSPDQLLDVSWKDWLVSFNRAYAVLRNSCSRIILGGFSAGALLVLLNAARKGRALDSIFCIDTPLILMDRRACTLAPAALGLNRFMDKLHLPVSISDTLENVSETPHINYDRHYLHSVGELCKLISECRNELQKVDVPCLLIHASNDPVADPEGADLIYKTIGSEVKQQITIDADYHNLVQRDGREKVFEKVLEFIRAQSVSTLKEVA
jgi:esterase/lipase/1-acyl-sn-glycerol-3-phosphate acyltransferase